MNIICSKEKLLENINIVSKAVSNRTTLPILECILLLVYDDVFKLISNDLEMAIETSSITSEIKEPGSVALEAKVFSEIIRRLPDGMISISSDDNNVVKIKCGRSEFKILGLSGDEFPYLPEVEKNNCTQINSPELKNIIRQTIFSVAVEESKPVLTGELMEIKEGRFNMVAVDGFRVACKTIEIVSNEESLRVVVPAKTLSEISKIIPTEDANISIYFTDKHVLFETDHFTVVSRLIEGEFIKYEQIFTDDFTTLITIDRHALLMSLERASIIASKEAKKNPVKLKIRNDTIAISSNTEMGTVHDELPVEIDGADLEISFNPKYLMDAIKVIEENTIVIQFTTPLSPCIIKGLENDKSKYLVLPLRLKS